MSVLNLRGVDEALVQQLKREALGHGITLKAWCVEKLGVVDCGWYDPKLLPPKQFEALEFRLDTKPEKREQFTAVVVEPPMVKIEPKAKARRACPICSGPLIPWGTSERCEKCQRNW